MDDVKIARKELADAIRTIIRLKYRHAQNREIARVEAEELAEFDRRLAEGEPYQPDLSGLIRGELL